MALERRWPDWDGVRPAYFSILWNQFRMRSFSYLCSGEWLRVPSRS